MSLNEQNVNLQ